MSEWRWYTTVYPARPEWKPTKPVAGAEEIIGDYASAIHATSPTHAKALARKRNIGERLTGGIRAQCPYHRPSRLLRAPRLSKRQALDAIHGMCFLSYLLMRSCGLKAEDLVGDEGLMHMAIHALSFGWPNRRKLAAELEAFERMVPGYAGRGA